MSFLFNLFRYFQLVSHITHVYHVHWQLDFTLVATANAIVGLPDLESGLKVRLAQYQQQKEEGFLGLNETRLTASSTVECRAPRFQQEALPSVVAVTKLGLRKRPASLSISSDCDAVSKSGRIDKEHNSSSSSSSSSATAPEYHSCSLQYELDVMHISDKGSLTPAELAILDDVGRRQFGPALWNGGLWEPVLSYHKFVWLCRLFVCNVSDGERGPRRLVSFCTLGWHADINIWIVENLCSAVSQQGDAPQLLTLLIAWLDRARLAARLWVDVDSSNFNSVQLIEKFKYQYSDGPYISYIKLDPQQQYYQRVHHLHSHDLDEGQNSYLFSTLPQILDSNITLSITASTNLSALHLNADTPPSLSDIYTAVNKYQLQAGASLVYFTLEVTRPSCEVGEPGIATITRSNSGSSLITSFNTTTPDLVCVLHRTFGDTTYGAARCTLTWNKRYLLWAVSNVYVEEAVTGSGPQLWKLLVKWLTNNLLPVYLSVCTDNINIIRHLVAFKYTANDADTSTPTTFRRIDATTTRPLMYCYPASVRLRSATLTVVEEQSLRTYLGCNV